MNNPEITAPTNEAIKGLKKLQHKKYRLETGQFVVENAVIIHDAMQAGIQPQHVFITKELAHTNDAHITFITQHAAAVTIINERVNKAFSSLATPSGIAAVFTIPTAPPEVARSGTVVYLNGISDPGNVGTILRTAVAFGVTHVIVDEACADIYNPKTIQAAKESIFKLNIYRDTNLRLAKQTKEHMPLVATAMQGTPLLQSSVFKNQNLCIILGSEAHGVAPALVKLANEAIAIPMPGTIESLNVAVSAGIILWARTA